MVLIDKTYSMQHFLFLVFFFLHFGHSPLASSRKNANLTTTAENLMTNVVVIKDLASKERWPDKLSYIKRSI